MSDGKKWLSRHNVGDQVPIGRVIAALGAANPGDVCVLGVGGFIATSRPSLEYLLDLSGSTGEPSDLLFELVVQ